MKIFLVNVFVLVLVAAPLLLLHIWRYRYDWLRKHYEVLSIVVWLATLLVVYAFVLPRFGLVENPLFH